MLCEPRHCGRPAGGALPHLAFQVSGAGRVARCWPDALVHAFWQGCGLLPGRLELLFYTAGSCTMNLLAMQAGVPGPRRPHNLAGLAGHSQLLI